MEQAGSLVLRHSGEDQGQDWASSVFTFPRNSSERQILKIRCCRTLQRASYKELAEGSSSFVSLTSVIGVPIG
jgi:hypothetical protein